MDSIQEYIVQKDYTDKFDNVFAAGTKLQLAESEAAELGDLVALAPAEPVEEVKPEPVIETPKAPEEKQWAGNHKI